VYLWSVIATLTEKPHQRYFQNYANIRFFADAAENAATCFGLLASHPWYYGRQWERWRILFTMKRRIRKCADLSFSMLVISLPWC